MLLGLPWLTRLRHWSWGYFFYRAGLEIKKYQWIKKKSFEWKPTKPFQLIFYPGAVIFGDKFCFLARATEGTLLHVSLRQSVSQLVRFCFSKLKLPGPSLHNISCACFDPRNCSMRKDYDEEKNISELFERPRKLTRKMTCTLLLRSDLLFLRCYFI